MNAGEYNTIDLVKDITKKKTMLLKKCICIFFTIIFETQEKGHNVLFQTRHNLDFGHQMAAISKMMKII